MKWGVYYEPRISELRELRPPGGQTQKWRATLEAVSGSSVLHELQHGIAWIVRAQQLYQWADYQKSIRRNLTHDEVETFKGIFDRWCPRGSDEIPMDLIPKLMEEIEVCSV